MAKPWGRIELGYLNHPKFLALNANAICLWHEGKNYCDAHQTDGLIPTGALKAFRFRGQKSVEGLMTSCGQKPGGAPWAPLWEVHAVGYKMHDYLDYNDCREVVLARLQDAEDAAALRKVANTKRQAEFRARRKEELAAPLRNVLRNAENNVTSRTPTETVPETETKEERTKGPAPRALLATWNQHAVTLPKCGADTADRLKAAATRLREHPDLAWWASVVVRMEASDFLTGRRPGRGHENWRADIDWFLKPGRAAKVIEGKYDNRSPAVPEALSWAARKAAEQQKVRA